ncbi:Eco57I restriction-modification methylase domain-containing protein [Undibacterium sp. Ji83W]|uniref:Eco57I restriction-modification methylase domain-containing protein n=1 Tax=Undibacterium sp. Ji83W TaxID=3413043 RepID=UPI003BF4306F
MNLRTETRLENCNNLQLLAEEWGSNDAVNLYLDRCQVDTPSDIVTTVWDHIKRSRKSVSKVVDFGAGDGRFSHGGIYEEYIGYEIDSGRCKSAQLPVNAKLINQCAFQDEVTDAQICLGNPPYVRNQDLPIGWRQRVSATLAKRTGVTISGLSNAWQYFFLLAIASTSDDGLVAIVIPYEWVSRPSSRALREYIKKKGWNVNVYRLLDDTFHRVLTTSSITIIDKKRKDGVWEFFEQNTSGNYEKLSTASGGESGVIAYSKRSTLPKGSPYAKRGLSPGTQEVLTLTEGERVHMGLRVGDDVVPCVTSLKCMKDTANSLTENEFRKNFQMAGLKCWLIRTDKKPSSRLQAYLDNVSPDKYQTSTCLSRDIWWKFTMPDTPAILISTGFTGNSPKTVLNKFGVRALGGVCGIYGLSERKSIQFVKALRSMDLSGSIVPHSNGLKKIEINQLNTIIETIKFGKVAKP